EERSHDHLVQVEPRQHLRVPHHRVELKRLVERREEREEEVAGEREIRGEQDVRDRRREVRTELLARDGEDVPHRYASASAARAPSPASRPIAAMKTSSRLRPRVRFASMSSTTIRPSLMMTTLSHTWDTSGRMCVDSTTVRFPPSVLISCRISMIWRGSRPIVGSSSTRTGGAWMSACAGPAPRPEPLQRGGGGPSPAPGRPPDSRTPPLAS